MLLVLVLVVVGNSSTAAKLKNARNIKLQGAVSGNANFDGSENIIINTAMENIVTITGTLVNDNDNDYINATVELPEGYNSNNCVVVSTMVQNANKTEIWANETTFDSASYVLGGLKHITYLKDNIVGIRVKMIQIDGTRIPFFMNITSEFNFKIVLLKIA